MTERRMTKQTVAILRTLATNPSTEWWGTRIAPAAGLKSGTLYPALMRLEQLGWLASRWEEIDPKDEGRPRRRLYRLTAEGERVVAEVFRSSSVGTLKPIGGQQPPAGVPQGSLA